MYNLEYYELMLRQNSASAEAISKIRWDFISQLNPKIVLDYGSGPGWFRAWRPEGVEVCSYDVANYPQTGIELLSYDVVCFWDVLEHIPDFKVVEPVLRLSNAVAVSIPVTPSDPSLLTNWQHFKPGEHLHYFTTDTICALFKRYGFHLSESNQNECPPRKDITSFLFTRKSS